MLKAGLRGGDAIAVEESPDKPRGGHLEPLVGGMILVRLELFEPSPNRFRELLGRHLLALVMAVGHGALRRAAGDRARVQGLKSTFLYPALSSFVSWKKNLIGLFSTLASILRHS